MGPATETPQAVELEAWTRFLRAHAALTRELNAELLQRHALTLNDYEVLLVLAQAEERRLRRVDIAERVLLTPSGVTRLLDGLEAQGWVEKAPCEGDRRVVYAQLTDAGLAALRDAAETHLAGVHRLFLGRFDEAERRRLADLLGRLPLAAAPGDRCDS